MSMVFEWILMGVEWCFDGFQWILMGFQLFFSYGLMDVNGTFMVFQWDFNGI